MGIINQPQFKPTIATKTCDQHRKNLKNTPQNTNFAFPSIKKQAIKRHFKKFISLEINQI